MQSVLSGFFRGRIRKAPLRTPRPRFSAKSRPSGCRTGTHPIGRLPAGAAAKAAGTPPPAVCSVSQNDGLKSCECADCQALARREESECGRLLDLVNFLADGIKDRHPDVLIDTLAYQYIQKAPKTIRPRDNVVVRLCDTESDPTQPITSPANQPFREHLSRWSQIARNLRVWDYAVTYASPVGNCVMRNHAWKPAFWRLCTSFPRDPANMPRTQPSLCRSMLSLA